MNLDGFDTLRHCRCSVVKRYALDIWECFLCMVFFSIFVLFLNIFAVAPDVLHDFNDWKNSLIQIIIF